MSSPPRLAPAGQTWFPPLCADSDCEPPPYARTLSTHDRALPGGPFLNLSREECNKAAVAMKLRVFFVKLPQNRHPERSASPIYRVRKRLWRGVEGPRRYLITHAAQSFSSTGPAVVFSSGPRTKQCMKRCTRPLSAYRSASCCCALVVEKL